MDSAKAQWDEALKAAIHSFRLLTSQSDSKSWKPVLPPVQPSSFATGPNGSSASTSLATASNSSSTLPRPVKDRTVTPKASLIFNPSSPQSVSSPKAQPADRNGKARTEAVDAVPVRSLSSYDSLPFSPLQVDASSVTVHRRNGGKAVGLPTGVDVYRAVVDVPFEGTPELDPFRSALVTPEARTKCESK